MTGGQRWVVGLTGGGVAALAVVFATLSWDRADQVAGVASALVGVRGWGPPYGRRRRAQRMGAGVPYRLGHRHGNG